MTTPLQPDLFEPLLFHFEITAREIRTERRWREGVPPAVSYTKRIVIWFTEHYQAEAEAAALSAWAADHNRAQVRGVINRGPVEST